MSQGVFLNQSDDLDLVRVHESQADMARENLLAALEPLSNCRESFNDAFKLGMAQINEKWGCTGDVGRHKSVKQICLPSKRHPDHSYKVGRFVLSHGPAGLDEALARRGIDPLMVLLEPDEGLYTTCNWRRALRNVNKAQQDLIKSLSGQQGQFDVRALPLVAPDSSSTLPASEFQALREALPLLEGLKSIQGQPASLHKGDLVIPGGMNIHALIHGTQMVSGSERPCLYAIYRVQPTDPLNNWYVQALDVVKETLELVLDSGNEGGFFLTTT